MDEKLQQEEMCHAVGDADKAGCPKNTGNYPDKPRMVEAKSRMAKMTFVTGNFEWPAFSICRLRQCLLGDFFCILRIFPGPARTQSAGRGEPLLRLIFSSISMNGTTNAIICSTGCSCCRPHDLDLFQSAEYHRTLRHAA